MKIISKIVVWILSLVLVFIFANLLIWSFKTKWINNYAQLLSDKEWSETISQVTIANPISIFSIFSVSSWAILPEDNNIVSEMEDETENKPEIIIEINTWENQDPYDPEFEDEFNSFFWWEDEQNNDSIILEESNLDDVESVEPAE